MAALGIFQFIVDMAVVLVDMLVSIQLRVFQLSLISFHVAPSNKTTSQSVELFGQSTSHAHSPSCQSSISKLVESPSVSVIVTVVVFHALELVTLAIQFQVGHVGHCGHSGHVGHCGHSGQISHCGHWSHFVPLSHWSHFNH